MRLVHICRGSSQELVGTQASFVEVHQALGRSNNFRSRQADQRHQPCEVVVQGRLDDYHMVRLARLDSDARIGAAEVS